MRIHYFNGSSGWFPNWNFLVFPRIKIGRVKWRYGVEPSLQVDWGKGQWTWAISKWKSTEEFKAIEKELG